MDSKLSEDMKILQDELNEKHQHMNKKKSIGSDARFMQQLPTQAPSYFTSLAANPNTPGALPNSLQPVLNYGYQPGVINQPIYQSYTDPSSTSAYAQAPVQTQAAGPYYEPNTGQPAYYYGYQPMIANSNMNQNLNSMRFTSVHNKNPNSAAPTDVPSKSQSKKGHSHSATYPGYVLHAPYGYYSPAVPYPAPYPAVVVPASNAPYYNNEPAAGYPVYYGYDTGYFYGGPLQPQPTYAVWNREPEKKDFDKHLKSDLKILKDELKDNSQQHDRFLEVVPVQKKQTHNPDGQTTSPKQQTTASPTQQSAASPKQQTTASPKQQQTDPYGHPIDLNHDPYFEPPVTTHRSTPNLFKDTQSFYPPRQYFVNGKQQHVYYPPSGYRQPPAFPTYPAPQEFPFAFSGEDLASNNVPTHSSSKSTNDNTLQSDIAVLKSELKSSKPKSNEIISKKFRFRSKNQWTSPLDNAISPEIYPLKPPPYMPHKRLMFNPWHGYYAEHVDGQYTYHPSLQPVAKKKVLTDINFPGPEPHSEPKPHILGIPFKNPLHPVVNGKELVVAPNNPVTPYIEK